MAGTTKLFLALLLAFVLSLLAFAAELSYVLWYRRRFQREPPGAGDPEVAAAGDPHGSPNSKELLLYFLCLSNPPPNHRASAAVVPAYPVDPPAPGFPWPASPASHAKPPPPPPQPPCERGLYGPEAPSTIGDEEEEEGPEPDCPVPPRSQTRAAAWRPFEAVARGEKGAAGEKDVVGFSGKVVEEGEGSELDVGLFPGSETQRAGRLEVVAGGEEQEGAAETVFESTPFSTPCGTPPFYTPSPSPPRWGQQAGWDLELSPESDGSGSDEEVVFFCASEPRSEAVHRVQTSSEEPSGIGFC